MFNYETNIITIFIEYNTYIIEYQVLIFFGTKLGFILAAYLLDKQISISIFMLCGKALLNHH